MKRRIRLLLVLLALLLLLPLAALWALTHSEATLQSIARHLPQRFGSIERLAVTGVQGTLAGGLRIASIDIEHDVVAVRLRDLRLRIDTLPLLWQTLEVRGFDLAELRIEQRPRDQPPSTHAPRFLPGMLTLWTEQARIRRIVIQPLVGNPVELHDLEASGTLYGKAARIRKASVALYDLHIAAQGLITSDLPLDLEGTATATLTPARGPRWVMDGRIDGDLDSAVVEGGIREPFSAVLEDGELRALGPWHLKGRAKVSQLDLAEFGGGKALGILSGELGLRFDKDAYVARGTMDSTGLGAGPVEVDAEAMYARRVLTLRRVELHHAASGTHASAAGTVTLLERGQRIALDGRWQAFRWPLTGKTPVVTSPQGSFTLAGTGPYTLASEGRIVPTGLPPVDGRIEGVLHPGRLEIGRGELRALGGRAQLVGEVSWMAPGAWRFKGPVRGIDPAQLRPDLPGSLDFTVDAQGTGFGAARTIDVDVRDLSGRLRGTAARGAGSLRYARDTLTFKRIDVAAGGFRLALDGELSPRRRDLSFRVAATDLGVLAAGARGSLRATGNLRGTPAAMRVEAKVDGRGISIQGVDIERLEADIDVDPTGDPSKPARAMITARGIEAFGQAFRHLSFALDGPVADHALRIGLDGKDLGLEADGRGTLKGDRWTQRWDRAQLALPADIRLSLAEPLRLVLAPGEIEAAAFCLKSRADRRWTTPPTLCAEGGIDAAGWRAKGQIRDLPLASLLDPPSPRASYAGTFDATADLHGRGDGAPLGTLRIALDAAALRWQRTGAKEELIALGTGLFSAESTAEGVSATLKLTAGDRGRVDGTLRAPHVAGGWRSMPLEATLRADSSALVLLHLYVPEIDRAAGALSLDLVAGGTLGAPLVNGVMRLERGELDFYQFNTALRDVEAEARLIDNRFMLRSTARLGQGRIEADAELEWRGRQPYGQLTVKGDELLLVDVPEATIKASPDLKLRVAGRDLTATGIVRVPAARLVPADLTGAVLPSADEVMAGEEPADPASGFRVSSNIRLVLGDKVTVEALGLEARLAGSLSVVTQPDGTSRGSGELGVAEGKYMALGRRLDIERGRLLFTGGPLGDPGVDIRATKEFPDVKAGVNVRGTLGGPRMSFFSEPSFPQSQIVSLLLAGGSVEGTQTNDAAAGRAALIAQGGAILAQQLGQRIGIEDVGIEQNLANETSLVFGKYLSTRLYVSYGISLAEAINTLKLRYTIDDRWTIKLEAGKEASTDIVYTVEKP